MWLRRLLDRMDADYREMVDLPEVALDCGCWTSRTGATIKSQRTGRTYCPACYLSACQGRGLRGV